MKVNLYTKNKMGNYYKSEFYRTEELSKRVINRKCDLICGNSHKFEI
ncbi:hypothetical protein LEP1GSC049_1614 [Leptospira kirschneri serovar Cynopteri str. 3522 CT]|nr:hypothetical protein LEP1GSC049_1614 [Leptospira kirschneri serovar Cynopteri str. 3522 CT]